MRLSWDEYFLQLASVVATRATCNRLHVGCVLVKDNRIASVGYNGSVSGEPHCQDVGCAMEHGRCTRTVHAEANAIASAARHGIRVDGATAYVTHTPCHRCAKLLRNAGIVRVVEGEKYP